MLCAFILSDGHGDVVDGQTPFLEQVFAHVGEGGRRVDGVASDAVLLKVRRRVPTLFTSDMTKQGMLNSVFLSLSLSLFLFLCLSRLSFFPLLLSTLLCFSLFSLSFPATVRWPCAHRQEFRKKGEFEKRW